MPKPVRFVYFSHPTKPVAPMILDLVRAAEKRNRLLGVSGMLGYDQGLFAQVIEGHSDAVDALVCSILRDPRHIVFRYAKFKIEEHRIGQMLGMGYCELRHCKFLQNLFDTDLSLAASYLIEQAHALYPETAKLPPQPNALSQKSKSLIW